MAFSLVGPGSRMSLSEKKSLNPAPFVYDDRETLKEQVLVGYIDCQKVKSCAHSQYFASSLGGSEC